MGKEEAEPASASEGHGVSGPPPHCCTNVTCKWLIPVVLGVYVLLFALWSVGFQRSNGRNSHPASPPPWLPRVEASFILRRSALQIHESLFQLQVDLQNEIGIPDTQIDIVSISPLSYKNWTEIRFTVSPDTPSDSIASPELSLLKDTFVELFMQRSANLSLTSPVFGRVSHFEVLQFPGGITVVPPQPGFPLSKVLVLFNFSLHNSLSHVHRNFAQFRQQLADGIVLKPNENLFVQLTNLEGSTVNSPVVVQTSILPVVGVMLPFPRLKQLASEMTSLPERNLGLNHTLFGIVREIELSSYLKYSLESAEAPSPSPSPAPAFSPRSCPGQCENYRHRGVRRHGRHSRPTAPRASPDWRRGRHSTSRIAPSPQESYGQHSEGVFPPMYSPSQPSWQLQPSSSPSISSQPPYGCRSGLSPHPTVVANAPMISHPAEPSPSTEGLTAAPTPTLFKGQSDAPTRFIPAVSPSPSQLHGRIALTPGGLPPQVSSAIILSRVSLWVMVMCTAFFISRW